MGNVARGRGWRGLLEWWRPSRRSDAKPDREVSSEPGWQHYELASDPGGASLLADDEATEEELREFLAADFDPIEADPDFKEELREQLWSLIREGGLARRNDH